jgi:hypothetical protein
MADGGLAARGPATTRLVSTCGDGPRVFCGRPPPGQGRTPGLLPASDSKRGAALVAGGAGRARVARYAALAFSDVPRVLPAVGDDFADGGRVVTMPEACPGIPHPALGFSMAVEVCRVRPGCLPWAQSRQCERALPGQRTLPHCLRPGNAVDRHRPLLSPTLCAGPVSRSVRAFTSHVSPPAGEPAAFHLSVRTSPEPGDRDAPLTGSSGRKRPGPGKGTS